jgi:hypothetical protein
MTNIRDRIRYRKRNSVDPEEYLLDADVIQPTDDEKELELTDEFASELAEYVEAVREEGVEEEDLASLWGVELDEVETKDREYPAYKIINTVRNWPTEESLVFDIAVDRIMRQRQDDWDDVPPRQRYRIAQSLRTFQDECLFCGGAIIYADEPVESCCTDQRVLTLHCDDCDRRFMEFATEDGGMADSVGT